MTSKRHRHTKLAFYLSKLRLEATSCWCLFYSMLCFCLLINHNSRLATADDSQALDMNALASLASNLGSNPQIMNIVSNLFNQNGQKPSTGGNFAGLSSTEFGVQDQEPTSLVQEAPSAIQPISNEQAKRVVKPEPVAPAAPSSQTATTAKKDPAGSNGLGSLMALLPSVLPNLNLGALFGNKAAASATSTPPAAAPVAPQTNPPQAIQANSASPSQSQANNPAGGGSAQTVINQILSAYASGQIPNELIQLALSGKVPPQIIELALSGQVPPQLMQMIITGQVPMPTINAFLGTMQTASAPQQTQSATPATSSSLSSTGPKATIGGITSTTRAIFEALFKSAVSNSGGSTIKVPTLLGPVPIPVPNVRRIGQMVGGTITNVSSLIPF